MAKIVPIEIIASMSGKVCRHSDMYFQTNRQTGKVHTAKICYPSTQPPTEKQLAQRAKFAAQSKAAAEWIKANRPGGGTRAEGVATPEYEKMLNAYKSQHQIGAFIAFVRKRIAADGSVAVPEMGGVIEGGSISSGGTTPGGGTGGTTPSTGGGDTDGME